MSRLAQTVALLATMIAVAVGLLLRTASSGRTQGTRRAAGCGAAIVFVATLVIVIAAFWCASHWQLTF